MNATRTALIALAACAGMLGLEARAADAKVPNPPDPDLPQPLDPALASPLLQSSPFTRALNLSESISLTGIAYVKGKPVATLTDKATKRSYLVSEEPNALGWRLAEALPSAELKRTQVKIYVGGEVVTIRYADTQIAPARNSSGYGPSRMPTEREYLGRDEHGNNYIRGSVYLSDEDRDRYYKGFSREAHEKFRNFIRDNRDRMFNATPEERTAFAKKAFDAIDREDRARQGK